MEVKTNGQSKVRPDIFLTENDFLKYFFYLSLQLVTYFRFKKKCIIVLFLHGKKLNFVFVNFMLWSVSQGYSNCGHCGSLIVIPLFSLLSV